MLANHPSIALLDKKREDLPTDWYSHTNNLNVNTKETEKLSK